MINVCRQTQRILLVPSTHATCFGHHWPSSSIKYVTYKTHNKMHIIQFARSRKKFLLEKLKVFQLLKKFAPFCETRILITVFTRARNLSLTWATWTQPTPSLLISVRFIWIVFIYLRHEIPNCQSLQAFPPKHSMCKHFSYPPYTCQRPRPSHPPWFQNGA